MSFFAMISRALFAAALPTLLLLSAAAQAQVAPPANPTPPTSKSLLERHLDLEGYLRLRFDVMANLDLNRGPTPTTGQTLYPTSLSQKSDTLTSANMRVRLDPSIRVGWGVSMHFRIDVLDNIVLGSTPEGLPISTWAPLSGGSASQNPPESGKNAVVDAIAVKRAWGQVILPIGVLAAGRMGALVDWGTGFFINSGNCIDCNLGDVGDRVSFVMPIFDILIGFAFDFGASGPTSATLRADPQAFDVERRDNVRSYALMATNVQMPNVVERYRRARTPLFMYGVVAALRTQEDDVPAYYLTGDLKRRYDEKDVVRRGILAFAADLWLAFRYGGFSVDFEIATVISEIDNASLLPGTEFLQSVTARQIGGVLKVEQRWPRWTVRMETGFASGDDAPGFGVRAPLDQISTQPGDIDGPQVRLPGDTTVNNFRFNPDYFIDQILWRRIVGTVSDAVYVRPSAAWRPLSGLTLDAALIASFAMSANSAPASKHPLGVELNLGLRYRLESAFEIQATYAVLFPLAGLDNRELGLSAQPAHMMHMVFAYLL
jgi:uncharacterized protein (TIGR04551 family)